MSGEQPTGQDTPAVAGEVTQTEAAQDNAVTPATETASAAEETTPVARTYSEEELQDRIERATAKAAAKAERRAFREAREQLSAQPVQQAQPVDTRPRRDHFTNDEEFIDKLTDWKIDQRTQGSRQAQQQTESAKVFEANRRVVEAASKLPGFDQDVFEEMAISEPVAAALRDSDVAGKVLAHLTSNPKEMDRINALPPARQVAEIGKLEAKLGTAPKTSKATPPINPVGSSGTAVKNLSTMSMEDFIKERQKAGSRWI